MPTPDITSLTAGLRALGGQRVWSLMISLFGDLAQGEGDEIDGPVLSTIMTALEVKPEATRVALHRLRNDGWITSTKVGRISRHSLTQKSRVESAAASPTIYAGPSDGPEDWQLVMLEDSVAAMPDGLRDPALIRLTPRVYIGPLGVPVPDGAMVLEGAEPPQWLCNELIPPALMGEYASMLPVLQMLAHGLPDPAELSPLATAVLRCVVVHNWRRLVLKHPMPPRGLIDVTSANHQCHLLVDKILRRYPRPALSDLGQAQAAA